MLWCHARSVSTLLTSQQYSVHNGRNWGGIFLSFMIIMLGRLSHRSMSSVSLLPPPVSRLPHPTAEVYLIGSSHDSTLAAQALRELQGDLKEKEPLALGLELCYGRINRMKFVKSEDIKALWQFSKDNPTTQLHALDVSPGEAAKEVFRDMPLVGIMRVAWYVIMRRLLSPLAERVLLWRILYYPTVERMPVVDEWIMRWRVPTPVMKIIRSMMATASTVDDIRDAIEKKYPPSKERTSYLQDSTLDPKGYIQLCDQYKIDKRLQEVVIDMRDEYMYRALWRLACKHNRVIAVVGENHVKGIHRRWMANDTGKRLSLGSGSGLRKFKFEEAGVMKQWLVMELLKQ